MIMKQPNILLGQTIIEGRHKRSAKRPNKYDTVIKVEVFEGADQKVNHKFVKTRESTGKQNESEMSVKPGEKKMPTQDLMVKQELNEDQQDKGHITRTGYFRTKRESVTVEQMPQAKRNYVESAKKKIEKMSEEQQAAEKRKKKMERTRKKRESMTPEQRDEERRKRAQNTRKKRENMTEEQKAEYRRKCSEQIKKKRENMTEEQKAEARRKGAEHKRKIIQDMTEEEKAEYRRKQAASARARYAARQSKVAEMTNEQQEELKLKKYFAYQAKKYRYREKSEEMKEKSNRKNRKWRQNLTGEKRIRYLEKLREGQKKWREKARAENNASWMRYQNWLKEYQKKRPVSKEYAREYQKKRMANETPEERLRRHHKYKVNAAARKLKQRLMQELLGEDQIERIVAELKTAMWREFDPDYDKRPRKPRGRRRQVTPPPEPGSEPGGDDSNGIAISCSSEANNDDDGNDPDGMGEYSPMSTSNAYEPQEIDDGEYFAQHSISEIIQIATPFIQCPHCPSVFDEENQLRPHVSSVHPEKCWKCPKCAEVVLSPLELAQHYNSSHKNEEQVSPNENAVPRTNFPFLCMRCPPSSSSSGQLNSFETRLELFAHVKTMHRQHYWPCERCNLLKYTKAALKLHHSLCRS